MGKLRDKLAALQSLTIDKIENEVLVVLRSLEDVIIGLNHKQLLEGTDSKGESLGEYSNKDYKAMKSRMNPNGVVDLKLTGKFHQSWFLKADKFPAMMDASDSKRALLIEKDGFGEDVFGLTKVSKITLAQDHVKGRIQNKYREFLLLR